MGFVSTNLKVKNPAKPQRVFDGKFLVDTGAKYTVLPEKVWKRIGLKPERRLVFSLADGITI